MLTNDVVSFEQPGPVVLLENNLKCDLKVFVLGNLNEKFYSASLKTEELCSFLRHSHVI